MNIAADFRHHAADAAAGARRRWRARTPAIGSVHERVRARPAVTPQIAFGLGVGAIGLGVWGLLFPRHVARTLGLNASPTAIRTLFGVRELVTGFALAGDPTRTPVLWARVAGDVVDAAVLGCRPHHPGARAALGGVLLIAALDAVAAVRMAPARRTGSCGRAVR
jgi:hypothetical protein